MIRGNAPSAEQTLEIIPQGDDRSTMETIEIDVLDMKIVTMDEIDRIRVRTLETIGEIIDGITQGLRGIQVPAPPSYK